MSSKLDKNILKAIGENPEITINNLMFKLDKGGLHEGKTKRVIANHVYELRRQGLIKQLGQSSNVRYILASQAEPATEQEHQLAEARQREGAAASVEPEQLGVCDLIDIGDRYILTPRTPAAATTVVEPAQEQKITAPPEKATATQPTSVIVLDGRQAPPPSAATEKPFDARVSAIAEHIGTTVTLTIGKLIEDALREKETTITMQRQEIEQLGQLNDQMIDQNAQLVDQNARFQQDIAEQEQLYNELDERYNTLKKQLGQLAA
jgi:hypothetical protein